MQNSAILRINAEREYINTNPEYQRGSDVWTLEKKQLLIDSILNDFDVPKLYFHAHIKAGGTEKTNFDYSIVDGRQRIETIWAFIDDRFALSDDFEYFQDEDIKAASMRYSDLAKSFPRLKIKFDSFTLPIICIETSDNELIEEMFSRLNEAVPLNGAEKRNALGGPMASAIRTIAQHRFFVHFVRFPNQRQQHSESAAKLIFLEHTKTHVGRIVDTKKPYLDDMVRAYRLGKFADHEFLVSRVQAVLDEMIKIFDQEDPLLRAQARVPIFYLVVSAAMDFGRINNVRRERLVGFYEEIRANKSAAELDLADARFDFLEYDRLSQQGTNDAASIIERVKIVVDYLGICN